MSVRLMSQIWESEVGPPLKRLVLLAFADAANDDGVTWIAIQSKRGARDMLKKTRLSLRGLQGFIRDLEADGHLERIENPGKGCLWIVRPTPAGLAGVWASTPAGRAGGPAPHATKPLSNHQENEIADRLSPPVDKCPLSGSVLPPGLSLGQWEAFLDMRFSIGKQLKGYVAGVLLAKLTEWGTKWVAGDIVDRSTVNAWADLYEPEEGRVTGVRRVVAGNIAEPVGGLSEEEKAELRRIAHIDDVGEMLQARRDFFERQERRNTPTKMSKLVGELALCPPRGRPRRKG